MKRMHVNLRVHDLQASIQFYQALFDAHPDVVKPDYARWMLDEPRVNFALSADPDGGGIDHLGIQVDSEQELEQLGQRLSQTRSEVYDEGATTCCYAHSVKRWGRDPDGVSWETFLTTGAADTRGCADRSPSATCCAGR
jgi:predicted lactoylglutathione lyase